MRASNCAHKYRAGWIARVAPKSVRTVFYRSACGSRGSLWDREIEGATVHHTSGAARRRLGAYPDLSPDRQPAASLHHRRVKRAERVPNHHQRTVQCAQRADRVHARSCTPLLYEDRDGCLGARDECRLLRP